MQKDCSHWNFALAFVLVENHKYVKLEGLKKKIKRKKLIYAKKVLWFGTLVYIQSIEIERFHSLIKS